MSNITDLSPEQLRRAANIKEQIEKLQKDLQAILGNGNGSGAVKTVAKAKGARKGPSPEAIERIRAAQKARWAKVKGTAPAAKKAAPAKKATGKKAMSPQAKAKLAAKMKQIWAQRKAAQAK